MDSWTLGLLASLALALPLHPATAPRSAPGTPRGPITGRFRACRPSTGTSTTAHIHILAALPPVPSSIMFNQQHHRPSSRCISHPERQLCVAVASVGVLYILSTYLSSSAARARRLALPVRSRRVSLSLVSPCLEPGQARPGFTFQRRRSPLLSLHISCLTNVQFLY